MARVTSKLQVTVPKAIADTYGIRPGSEIEWVPAGDAIRVLPPATSRPLTTLAERLRLFDAATKRQKARQARVGRKARSADRGWRREDLYARGRAR